jgi:hypothetical protein
MSLPGPNTTALHSMMLSAQGAPEIPGGASLCSRLKSRMSLRLAGVDIGECWSEIRVLSEFLWLACRNSGVVWSVRNRHYRPIISQTTPPELCERTISQERRQGLSQGAKLRRMRATSRGRTRAAPPAPDPPSQPPVPKLPPSFINSAPDRQAAHHLFLFQLMHGSAMTSSA